MRIMMRLWCGYDADYDAVMKRLGGGYDRIMMRFWGAYKRIMLRLWGGDWAVMMRIMMRQCAPKCTKCQPKYAKVQQSVVN